jgi:hypothetical protein
MIGKWAKRAAIGTGLGLLTVAALIVPPIVTLEAVCVQKAEPAATRQPLLQDKEFLRPEANSKLSYPEWYIVHQYEDFADVLKQKSESQFHYLESISGFWSTLCGINARTKIEGDAAFEMKSMLYIIGLSYTAEMGIKGLYETTIGRLTEWLRGPERTSEDQFALRVADGYSKFLYQVPWYEYPFASELSKFWRETPMDGPGLPRKIERRVALSMEYGVKAAYAQVLKAVAGMAPADLRIRSVVEGASAGELAQDEGIQVIRELDGGRVVIETPRYRAYTEILKDLAERGVRVVEIAGNTKVLTTVVTDKPGLRMPEHAQIIFRLPLQSRPGFVRLGIDTPVDELSDLIKSLKKRGSSLEHVYDY